MCSHLRHFCLPSQTKPSKALDISCIEVTPEIAHVNHTMHTSRENKRVKSHSPRDVSSYKAATALLWPGSHQLRDSWNNKILFLSKQLQKGSSVLKGVMKQSWICQHVHRKGRDWCIWHHQSQHSRKVHVPSKVYCMCHHCKARIRPLLTALQE